MDDALNTLSIYDFPFPAFIVSENFHIMSFNDAFKELLDSEKAPKDLIKVFDFESTKSIQRAVSRLLEDPESKHLKLTIRLIEDSKSSLGNRAIITKITDTSFGLFLLNTDEVSLTGENHKNRYLLQLEELRKEYDECQELISTFKYLMNAFPQNSIQFDKYGDYTIIRDSEKKIFSTTDENFKNFWKDINPDVAIHVHAMLRRSQKLRKLITKEISFFDKNSKLVWLSVNVLFGKTFNLLTYTNITDDKNELEQMIEQERLSTIGVLSGGLAHQYNNLHHAVLAQIHEASETTEKKSVKKHLLKASLMLEEGASLSSSLLSHLRSTKSGTEVTSLKEIFKRVRQLVNDQLTIYNCKLIVDVDETLIDCNISEIDQVMVNLIINAAQACFYKPEESCVKIMSRHKNNQEIEILIEDNGDGIPKSKVKMLFTPLFSTKGVYAAEGSKESKFKGTGLGLNLARKICEKHQGSLKLHSTSSKGTTFSITLPIHHELDTARESVEDPQDNAPLEFKKVLIVDDSPENRNLLKVYLKDVATEFFECENGKEPLDQLDSIQPDLIFLDWLMPEAGGDYFISSIEKDENLKGYLKKTIILSGLDNDVSIEKRKPLVAGVLNKPIPKNKLIKSLKDII